MDRYALTKLSLVDYPGIVACTVFTYGCNFRCPFCHNAPLVLDGDESGISEEEVLSFLDKRRNVLDGVCVSGGEPLIRHDIDTFLRKVKDLGYLVKLDTNGFFPEKLKNIVSNGTVDYVAMDIKSSPEDYARSSGCKDLDVSKICESVDFLISGSVDYEFRTTVVKGLHDLDVLVGAAKSIKGAKRYFLQKFVDSGNIIGSGFSAFSDVEMEKFLKAVSEYVAHAELRGVQ